MASADRDSRVEQAVDLLATVREAPASGVAIAGDLYRGEIERATAWRSRLDITTNWAVVVVAAILTWAFSSEDNPHYVLLIGMLAVTGFLFVEAHRYREYDIWRSRVRTMQENLLVGVLGRRPADPDWQRRLGESLARPTFGISLWEALGHRLRRTYVPLLLLLLVAWVARITVFEQGESWRQTAALPGVDGEAIVLAVAVVYVAAIGFAIWSARGTRIEELSE